MRSVSKQLAALAVCAALLGAAAAAAVPAPAPEVEPAGGDLREGLVRCLISPEMAAAADFTGIQAACSPDVLLEERCEDCPCALVDSIVATLAAAGYDPAAALATFSQEELAASLALCQDTLLAALVDAGVDTQPIFELSACADTVAALNACAAAVSGA